MNTAARRAAAALQHAAALPARIRHGRPLRITARAATIAILAARTIPGTPAAPAIPAGDAWGWAITRPPERAPPSQDHP